MEYDEPQSAASRPTMLPQVFYPSAILLAALLAFSVLAPTTAIQWFEAIKSGILTHFSWFYVLTVTAMVGVCLYLSLGPYAGIKLGGEDEQPAYSRASWYAMLFAAGMGIGLVFYGVAEPMAHARFPPVGEPLSPEALSQAMPLSFHHWGIHAWGTYAVLAICIGYFAYCKGLPLALRSCFYPIFGERIHGWVGHSIDILAVFGTLFGLATSLGAGAASVSAGLNRLFETPDGTMTQLIIIAVITAAATVSLVTGLEKGVKVLSEVNMVIATVLLAFVVVVGPTTIIFTTFTDGLGAYYSGFMERSLNLGMTGSAEASWIQGWSVVYWGWWIGWAPFVGVFVARISRGRTIRDIVLSVLFVPTTVTFFWFAAFGGTAISEGFREPMIAALKAAGPSADAVAVYALLEQLPLGGILSLIAVVVVTIFFVSSSDSASYVVDMLTSGGHPDPPVWQRVFWACAEGATAAALLYTGGQEVLNGLKAGVVSIGLPFCVLMWLMAAALLKALFKGDSDDSDGLSSSRAQHLHPDRDDTT